jgi:hypothetical protein
MITFLMKTQPRFTWRSLIKCTLPFTLGLVLFIIVVIVVFERVCEERQPNNVAYDCKFYIDF